MMEHVIYKSGLRDEKSPLALGRMIMDINAFVSTGDKSFYHPHGDLSVDGKVIQSVGIADHVVTWKDGAHRNLSIDQIHALFRDCLVAKGDSANWH